MGGADTSEYRIVVSADTDASRVAREFVEHHSDSLDRDVVDDAKLMVSELVTNAVMHGQPAITLCVTLDPPLIGVSVQDEGEDMPPTAVRAPALTAASGRGLMIIDSIASRWGVVPRESGPGKTVWFRLDAKLP
jgi:anti-sigma regulatory factor (Ser/Thr protein kinase)